MESPHSGHEQVFVERIAVLERDLVRMTVERDEYKSRAEWLHAQLERLRYDAKTPRERVDPRQLQLVFEPFAEALLGNTASEEAKEPEAASPPSGDGEKDEKKKRKITPHGRRVLPDDLPVETIVIKPSPLPEDAVEVGAEVSWRLGYKRGGFYRLRVLRPVYVASKEAASTSTEVEATLIGATAQQAPSTGGDSEPTPLSPPNEPTTAPVTHGPSTEDGESSPLATVPSELVAVGATARTDPPRGGGPNTTILSAPAPDEMIPRGLPTIDVLAHILVGKFADKLPFNRQQAISARDGLPITRGTMCGWTEAAHELARHVVDAMIADSRAHAHVIATDATGVLVQANKKCKNGHFFVYVADRDHVILRYAARHSSDEPKTFFKGFRGVVLSDASNVYDILFGLPDSPGEANCWSHARRYFYKAIESENREEALVGVGFCNELFALERQWKKLPHEQRPEMRKQRASPVIEMLRRWKDEQLANPQVHEGSRLRKALNYLTNQWTGLCKFLEDGRVPIDNNESERQLRSLVVGRANWLFVGSDDTAAWTCTFGSLMGSCQLNALDPEKYLRDLFRVLPTWPKHRMLELAPKFWRATRALLDDAQMALPLGPLTVPEARPLRETAAPSEHA